MLRINKRQIESIIILFLPVSILYVIDIFKRIKVILMILIITILVQLFFIHIWFESSNIFLNLIYGTAKIKLWIIIFGIIIFYAIIKIIINVINLNKEMSRYGKRKD